MPLNKQRRPSTTVEVSRSFRADFDAPGAVRRFLVETLDQAGVAEGMDDAKLVVTELATNAVLHARTGFAVSLCVTDGDLCISVSDDSPELPARSNRRNEDGGGRGLEIVAMLASGWGAEPTATGKRVWARLRSGPGDGADRGT